MTEFNVNSGKFADDENITRNLHITRRTTNHNLDWFVEYFDDSGHSLIILNTALSFSEVMFTR